MMRNFARGKRIFAIGWVVLAAGCGYGGGSAVKEIHIGRHHNNDLQIQIDAETEEPTEAYVRYWPDSLPGEVRQTAVTPRGLKHEMVLFNILPGMKYSYQVVTGASSTKVLSFETPALPLWLQDQFKSNSGALEMVPAEFKEGFMLLNKRETPGVDYIVDYKGRIRWYHTVDGTGFKVTHFTKDQTIVSILGKNDEPTSYGSEILEINLGGDTLTYLRKGMGDLHYSIHHEILKNEQGQFLTLYVDQRLMDLRSIGGGPRDTVNGDGILILDHNGHAIWRWSVFDVVDPLKDPQLLKTRRDWMHANSLNFDKDGNFIVSFYNNGQIWKIDAHTGRVLWKFGKGGDIKMPAECRFTQAHAVHINKAGALMFFDNGVENHLSEVFAVRLDEAQRKAKMDLHIQLPPDIYNDRMGSAYMITDSTVLCCSSKRKITVLVNRKGVLLWDMETAIPPYRVEFLEKEQVAPWLLPCTDGHAGVTIPAAADSVVMVDTAVIPHDEFGDAVRYGMALMYNTAYYIGPEGINGKFLGNKMNCTNCHQNAGTKAFSFNLMASHGNYPQYRAREGKVLTLAERVNNCVMRPHNGKPLPLDSKEMIGFLAYFKWINGYVAGRKSFKGEKNLEVAFPAVAADPQRGRVLYAADCARCHGSNGEGMLRGDKVTYIYPPLWGASAYQPGSSMHRIIKQAQWIKANMPYDRATYTKPFLTDAEALDIAAFVNDDLLHNRPTVKSFDYPHPVEKSIDYDHGPFADGFSESQHKYGPYPPIIAEWKKKGLKPVY